MNIIYITFLTLVVFSHLILKIALTVETFSLIRRNFAMHIVFSSMYVLVPDANRWRGSASSSVLALCALHFRCSSLQSMLDDCGIIAFFRTSSFVFTGLGFTRFFYHGYMQVGAVRCSIWCFLFSWR